MKGIKLANIVLLVSGVGLTVLGVVLLLVDGARDDDGTPPGEPLTGEELIAGHDCNFCHRTEPPVDRQHLARDNCQQCHQYTDRPEYLAPPLDTIAERRPEPWLRRFLKYPYPVRENSMHRMPDLLLSDREVETLTRHLVNTASDGIENLPDWRPQRDATPDPERLAAGRQLWEQYDCATCHSLGDHETTPQWDDEGNPVLTPVIFAPRLDDAWTRLRPEWIAEAVRRPALHLPFADMTQHDIPLEDARELAWFIWNAVPSPAAEVSHNDVMGVLLRHCADCHYGPDDDADFASNPEGGAGWIATFGAPERRLDLRSYDGLMTGAVNDLGERRPSVVPYASNSPILMHLKGLKQPRMPFGRDPVPAEEIELIERWIMSGAPGPAEATDDAPDSPFEFDD